MIDATLMLQREVADRIGAAPGSADYGVLSVLVQWKAVVTRLLTLPPGGYTVKVSSATGATGNALAEVYEVR